MTHCCADTYVKRAVATSGSATEVRAQKKVRMYALHVRSGYDLTPCVVEAYVRQCKATHALLNKLGTSPRIEGALCRLSVALCKGNDFVFRANLDSFCRATGKHPTRGAVVPHTLEV